MPALNYATQYQRALEQAFPYVLYFGALHNSPNDGRYKWTNEKTIEIPSVTTTGRTNANRDSIGTAQRNYNNGWETKTLVNERKWSTLVHPRDIQETNMTTTIANITKEFNDQHKFPEMDAYLISKLYAEWTTTVAATTGHPGYTGRTPNATAPTAENILDIFDALMLNMDNARVPAAGRILYITNELKSLLKQVASKVMRWNPQISADGLNRNIDTIDGVEVIAVPAELMRTVYDFSDDNGWAVDPLAAQVNMLLVNPIAVITPISYTFAKLDPPSALSEGKYYYYEESFEDVFILNNKADAIQFNVELNPNALKVTSEAGSASGKTKITVDPAKGTGNYYFYKTAATVDLPAVGDEISTGYTSWDGSADITATTGNEIVIVECIKDGDDYFAYGSGKAVVTSKAS